MQIFQQRVDLRQAEHVLHSGDFFHLLADGRQPLQPTTIGMEQFRILIDGQDNFIPAELPFQPQVRR
ncbi:MAG: hypothetical protein K8R36_09275 [Planctomycetales bacterium]|nr:hypothetical protein [Planctomycetales bacterium]